VSKTKGGIYIYRKISATEQSYVVVLAVVIITMTRKDHSITYTASKYRILVAIAVQF